MQKRKLGFFFQSFSINVDSALLKIGSEKKLVSSLKNICFGATQNGVKLNKMLHVWTNLSLNFRCLSSANHMKSTKECVMCMEKFVLIKTIFTDERNISNPSQSKVEKNPFSGN